MTKTFKLANSVDRIGMSRT